MKRGALFVIFIVFIILISNSVFAYSIVEKFSDDVKMFFASGDKKVTIALEIREKEIDSAIENAMSGNTVKAVNNLEDAKEKLKFVQKEVSPEIADDVIVNVQDVMDKILSSKEIDPEFGAYLEEHLSEEQKTQIVAQLPERIYNLCKELVSQDFQLMLDEPKCNPENAPDWLRDKIEGEFEELQEQAAQEMIEMLTVCINDPRECDCSGIPIATERGECEKGSALAVRCEFQEDIDACNELDEMGPPQAPDDMPDFLKPLFESTVRSLVEKKEKEMFKKFAPQECIDAGATTRKECEQIMIEKYGEPPEECVDNGRFIGEDECVERMIESGKIPQECVENGEFIGRESCESKMMAQTPQECIENGEFVGQEECERRMIRAGEIPEQCVENGIFIGREECEQIMSELGEVQGEIPSECMSDGQFIGEEECRIIMISKTPQECIENGEFVGREECERRMEEGKEEKRLVINEEGEQEYISQDEINEIIRRSEESAEGIEPDLTRANDIREGIEGIEEGVQRIEETGYIQNEEFEELREEMEQDRESDEGEVIEEERREEDVDESRGSEVEDEQEDGSEETSDSGESSGSENGGDDGGDSEVASGGPEVAGLAVREIPRSNSLVKLVRIFFDFEKIKNFFNT